MSFGGVLKGFPDLMSFVMFCCKLFTILRIDNVLVFYETNFCFGRKWKFILSTNFCYIWILNNKKCTWNETMANAMEVYRN